MAIRLIQEDAIRPSGLNAQRVFFPMAALFAAIAPWLLLVALPAHPEPAIVIQTHAQGMLFGYVSALIAGYLLGKQQLLYLMALATLWLAGRVAEICCSHTMIIHILYAGFGLALAVQVVPKFWVAKKWRNRVIGPLIAVITCFPIVYWLLSIVDMPRTSSLYSLILFIALLMFFMGGRFITPALTRAFAESGQHVPHRVQPKIEGSAMTLLMTAGVLLALGAPKAWVALLTGAASVLVLVRLYRWTPFVLGGRFAGIWALCVGYLWLGLGLSMFSASMVGGLPVAASLHIITVGALGTLSSTIMLTLSSKRSAPPGGTYYATVILLTSATACRFLADLIPVHRQVFLNFSATVWSINFILVAFVILLKQKDMNLDRL